MGSWWSRLQQSQRQFAGLLLAVGLWRFYRQIQEKKRWQDTPIGIWLLENSLVGFIAWLNLFLTRSNTKPPLLQNWLYTFIGGSVSVDGIMILQHFVVKYVYKHIPFFVSPDKRVPQIGLREIRWDYLRTMLPTQLFAGALAALAMNTVPAKQWAHVSAQPFRVLPFLFRFGVIRLAIDIMFYVVHRALHSHLLYPIHKRHHEHVNTALPTNYHFTPPDLALEGFVPVFFGTLVLDFFSNLTHHPLFMLLQTDVALIYAYSMWYEIGSHCGKPIPLSMFPPLAPLYNFLYRQLTGSNESLDQHNVLFHERHHNLVQCNYGITPWPDWLLGTAKMKPNPSSNRAVN